MFEDLIPKDLKKETLQAIEDNMKGVEKHLSNFIKKNNIINKNFQVTLIKNSNSQKEIFKKKINIEPMFVRTGLETYEIILYFETELDKLTFYAQNYGTYSTNKNIIEYVINRKMNKNENEKMFYFNPSYSEIRFYNALWGY